MDVALFFFNSSPVGDISVISPVDDSEPRFKICCKNIVKIVYTYHFLKKKKKKTLVITLIIPTGGNIREITPVGNFHNNHQIILLNHQMILAVGDSSSQSY